MIDENSVEETEKMLRDLYLKKVDEVHSIQAKSIDEILTNTRNIGYNVDINNTGITINNKIVELSHIFKEAGTSMFSSNQKYYNVIGSSFIGEAIILDLIGYGIQATQKLRQYNMKVQNISKRKTEQLQALSNINPVKKFFTKIKAFFIPAKPIDLSLTEEEQNILEASAQEYRDIDNKIYQYNLEDNMIPAILKEIKDREYAAPNVPRLLEKCVTPDLKKLGLERLVPQLQQELIEEYKRRLPSPEIYKIPEEDMYLYVPDFTKKSQTGNGGEVKRRKDTDIKLVNKDHEKAPEQGEGEPQI